MIVTQISSEKPKSIIHRQGSAGKADLPGLTGQNALGQATILMAIQRRNPAHGDDSEFEFLTEYPRLRLTTDRACRVEGVCSSRLKGGCL